jgi:hypothetical protein
MVGACSTHRENDKFMQYLGWIAQMIDLSEDLGINGMVMLKWILHQYGGELWIGLIWLV